MRHWSRFSAEVTCFIKLNCDKMGKRKLTAVCSHDASIGNVGAPLSIFVEPEETDQIV